MVRRLHRFDQNPARLGIARLRDRAQPARVAGRVLAGHQPEIGHQAARMGEAAHVVDLRHQDGSGHQLETAQAHQRLHRRVHPPLRHLRDQQLLEPREPLRAPVDRLQVLLEHGFERWQRQHQFPQVPLVRLAPVRLARVVVALAQEERLQPLLGALQIARGVGTSAGEVADRFVDLVGHVDARQFPGPMQPGQLQRVAPVGLLPAALGLRRLRRRHDDAVDPQLLQSPIQHEPGRTRLVGHVQHPVLTANFAQRLFRRVQIARHLAIDANLARAVALGDRDDRIILVDI